MRHQSCLFAAGGHQQPPHPQKCHDAALVLGLVCRHDRHARLIAL